MCLPELSALVLAAGMPYLSNDRTYLDGLTFLSSSAVASKQMLEAVHTIHEERVVHGDLKPANFVCIQGRLKLIDFGIAKAISNDTTNIVRDNQVRSGFVSFVFFSFSYHTRLTSCRSELSTTSRPRRSSTHHQAKTQSSRCANKTVFF
jgi:serine/threonine protein kinase